MGLLRRAFPEAPFLLVVLGLVGSLLYAVLGAVLSAVLPANDGAAHSVAIAVLALLVLALAAQVHHTAEVTSPGGQHSTAPPPCPATILHEHPPRCCSSRGGEDAMRKNKSANNAVIELLTEQIRSGRELGAQVFAYHKGRLVVAVCCGVYRPMDVEHEDASSTSGTNGRRGHTRSPLPLAPAASQLQSTGWRGVDSDTIFMSYSVAKGATATAMLMLADQGKLDWNEEVDSIWPALSQPGGGHGLTVAEAASHRLGLPGTPAPPARFWSAYQAGGWCGLWDEGQSTKDNRYFHQTR